MPTLNVFDSKTNLAVDATGFAITEAGPTVLWRVFDGSTNAWVGSSGGLYIVEDGTPDHVMTWKGMSTTLKLNANEGLCVARGTTITQNAVIAGMKTNIPMDANGRMVIATGGTASAVMQIGESRLNVNVGVRGVLVSGTIQNNLLLETGDKILQEDSGEILI